MNAEMMSIKELATYLNLSIPTVYRMTIPGKKKPNPLPHYKIQGSLRFSKEKIEKWLETKEVAA
ncbi:MAG TPA: helix-turn-helix domain-containing protein [Saprospiraceae bacterium]|nr:helix-turn-helix domain-containing protein [Saprospiraceae bacterium]